jgi:glucose/arabinose dehydrogenase/PKD repeat protein
MTFPRILLAGIFILTFNYAGFSQLPKDFYDQVYANGYQFPVSMEFSADNQLYIATKKGEIFVIDSSGAKLDQPLLDLSEEITAWNDHGMLDFALDPDFTSNGYIYLLYSVDPHYLEYYGTPSYSSSSTIINEPTIGRVTRYQADPSTQFTTIIPDSRKILLGESWNTGIPLIYEFHGLGTLLAANDRTLLISTGDATSNAGADIGGDSHGTMASKALELGIISEDMDIGSYRSQYKGAYSGKILRIDAATGDGLPSNPFYDPKQARAPISRIWALGFRNPYRIVLQPETGSHYAADGAPGIILVGDVGNGAWEELNVVTKGGQNFGWPIMEGIDLNWSFWTADVPADPLSPNPLFQTDSCDQAFFNFRTLFVRDNALDTILPLNPCSDSISIPIEFLTSESLPIIAWSNALWNQPTRAIVPDFRITDGVAEGLEVTETRSAVSSEAFDGYSSLAGAFYTKGNYPEAYQNTYFAVDFAGWIKRFEFDDSLQLKSIHPFHDQATDIIHLTTHPESGDLFYINLKGEIRTITYGGNPPPTAIIQADRYYGAGPLKVQFDGSDSEAAQSAIVAYHWDFGNGETSTAIQPVYTFTAPSKTPESFIVKLTVQDSLGATATSEQIISLNNSPPEVVISSFQDGDQYPVDATALLLLEAQVTDAEHQQETLQYEWRIFLHHNDHFHPEPAIYDTESYTLLSPLGCQGELYWYRIELTVTDPQGLQTQVSQSVYPNCGPEFWAATDLSGVAKHKSIDLNWINTIQEPGTSFLVQRSADLFNFQTIGTVHLMEEEVNYTFVDPNPLLGNNIYRIKARSQQGAFRYSNLMSVSYPKILDLNILPNPASDYFEVTVTKAVDPIVAFELYDLSGRRLLKTNWTGQLGAAFSKTIRTDHLISGTYIYHIQNGGQSKSGQLLLIK